MAETARRKSSATKTAPPRAAAHDSAHVQAATSLRGRVPSILPMQAEALRAFFGAPQRWYLTDGGVLRFMPAVRSDAMETVVVEGDGARLSLQLDGDDAIAAPTSLHWSDYTGRSRTLAWSLAHEAQLMRLSDALGIALLPVATADAAQDARDDDGLWLAFSIDAGDLDAAEALAPCRGRVRMPTAWLDRLLARAGQAFADDPLPDLQPWIALPAPVSILFPGPQLAAAEWRALRPGDVLVAGRRSQPPAIEAMAHDRAWPLALAAGRWRVEGPSRSVAPIAPSPNSLPLENPAMNDNAPTAASGEASDDSVTRSLPVRLEFELGQVEVSLGELAALQPGYVFNLPAHLEGANVTIRANGRNTGRGEVVAVGDTLGVRLLSWS